MGCEGSYATQFLKYLSDFVANIRSDDPLPVRLPNYKVTENEIDGQILDIVHHYLNSRECPPYVREYVGHQVWRAIRNPKDPDQDDDQEDDDDRVDAPPATNHTYDSMKLTQEVTSKANRVIEDLLSSLTPAEVEQLPRYFPVSHFAIKNGRRKMEDRHVIIHDLDTLYGMDFGQPHAYYGVFDGHAGIDAAVYSAALLHQYMIQNPQYPSNPEAALKHAFHITDTNFVKKAGKEKLKGGTTAVVALVREKRLVVAWLGDSQALLVRKRSPVRMVEPHKPELPVERERVEDMGGCVINIQGTWRVLGQLAVSRAIGDCDYKPYVSSECDIKSLEIEGDEDFLILACDGLWDTLTPEAAVNVVYAYLTHNNGDTDGVGRCLVEAARNTGSEDNITAVVVFLRPVTTLMDEEAQRIAQGQVPEPVPETVLCKDATPSSINAIFSPPVCQFEYSSPEVPTYNPFEGETPKAAANMDFQGMDTEEAATPATATLERGEEEPMEASEAPAMHLPIDDDKVAARAPPYDPNTAPTPTAEEVNAALASFEELDNIPDGVCESGEVEEEEEEEEEWSYYRMEPQTNTQGEDELVGGANSGDTNLVKEASSPADHSPYDLLSQPEQSESQIQDIHTTQESYQEVQTTQESFREEFLLREGKDIPGEAKLLDFEYQPLKEEMDSYQHDANTPMEADQPPVLDSSPDILQASMDNVPEPEISLDTMGKPEISSDKIRSFESSGGGMPDFLDNPAEPSSPHATGSPQMPGSPRSVEGFVTSVELNTPDESLGTNFNINQTQDLNGSGMDQPSGPFSVYVSSSPEPQSLEPSILPPSDLSNVSEVSNGHLEDEGKGHESEDFSPVEIVHAQSTVEVVAPPSPGEKLETEMGFVIPEHTPDLMTSSQILSDQPTDITFIPEPAIQPVAEVPVPVYLEGTTPVSEGDDQLSESLSTKEDVSESDKLPESPVAKMTMSPPPAALEPELIMKNQEDATIMPQEEMEVVGQVNNGLDFQETPAPVHGETVSPVVNEVIEQQEIKKESEAVVSSEVTSNELAEVIPTPEVVASPGLEKKTKVPEAKSTATKSPSKSAKTPVKSTLDKAGKTTPAQDTARKTPVSKTPTRTPLAKSTEKRTLASKTESKASPTKTTADKPIASRLTGKPAATTKPTTAKPSTAKPATAKPATTKPAAPKPTTTRPAPKTTTSRATTSTLSSTTKPIERKVPKPPTPTAPRASLSKPSSVANKPTTARSTPTTKTTPPTKRPSTAPVRTVTDKTDSGKVNGTSTARLGSRPGTASTSTTATRKPLTTTTRPATKPTAEKETKNTTNRILSTTRTAPKSTVGVTKTASKTSTVAGRSTLTESKTTSRVNGTTSTTTTKSRTITKSVAAKATDVAGKKGVGSKLKSAPSTKTSPGKAAPIIEASGTATVVNGENKIAHEETSVEVVEKCAAEDTVMTEKVLAEALTSTTTTQVITTETTEVIVNGDH